MNFMTSEDPLDLNLIRKTLIRLEDTIIFSLIERAQFAHNPIMYSKDGFASVLHDDSFKGSWLEWILKETEASHAKIRRYDSPDEHPFTPRSHLPKPILPPLNYPKLLIPNDINVNDRIMKFYVDHVVPAITKTVTQSLGRENDDGNYGSAGTRDMEALQAISRRIHCGMFVSESKFRSDPAAFVPHIRSRNEEALAALITKPEVEAALLKRLEKKAKWYGQELGENGQVLEGGRMDMVDAETIVNLYRDFVIPLTKDVEVQYLLERLDGEHGEPFKHL